MNKIESVDMDRASAEFIDNQGVADFADAMRRKLEKKRAEGRGGWHDPAQCPLNGTLTPLSIIIAAAEAKAREAEGK